MPKKTKDWRKVKALKGTIFDKSKKDDEVFRQRRCGFFVLHGVNPGAVPAGSAFVESIGDGRVRVHYQVIVVDEKDQRRDAQKLHIPIPVYCEHGGYKKRHTVKQIKSLDARLSEVL